MDDVWTFGHLFFLSNLPFVAIENDSFTFTCTSYYCCLSDRSNSIIMCKGSVEIVVVEVVEVVEVIEVVVSTFDHL